MKTQNKIKKLSKIFISLTLIVAMTFTIFAQSYKKQVVIYADENITSNIEQKVNVLNLKNPKKNKKGVVTWNCVYFGSYPQKKVKKPSSLIVNAKYDKNGDTTVNGIKYRRIRKKDLEFGTFVAKGYYDFSKGVDKKGYHYFKYEPIKWRVLSIDENNAFLMANQALDTMYYGYESTWEKSTLRNFLNNEFVNCAFSSEENTAIISTKVINEKNPFTGTTAGKNTNDKVYVLSIDEALNKKYGFSTKSNISDIGKQLTNSMYAYVKGGYREILGNYKGNIRYWLRSPGAWEGSVVTAYERGKVDGKNTGNDPFSQGVSVVPVLHLDLDKTTYYSYAGKVNNKGKKIQAPKVKNSNGKVKLKWKKVSGAEGYEIKYSTDKNFKKNKRTIVVKKSSNISKTISGLKKNKTYYFKVRGYRIIIGKIYDDWSNIKKVKIKK